MGIASSINERTVTCVIYGEIYSIHRDHPRAFKIINLLSEGADETTLVNMFNRIKALDTYMEGSIQVRGSTVYHDGHAVHGTITDRIIQFMDDGLPYQPLIACLKRIRKNKSHRASTELYDFLEHKGLPITPEGMFLAYKGVLDNYFSRQGNLNTRVLKGRTDSKGRIYNGVGEEIEVERSDVDDNRNVACGAGIHAGSYEYASDWGSRTVLVEIDPADVVSVPADMNCSKIRVCRYKVLADCTGKLHDTLVNSERPYEAHGGSPVTCGTGESSEMFN